jgi:hypothetical protein
MRRLSRADSRLPNTLPAPYTTCISNRSTRNSGYGRSGASRRRLLRRSRNWILSRNSKRRRGWASFWKPGSHSRSELVAVAAGRRCLLLSFGRHASLKQRARKNAMQIPDSRTVAEPFVLTAAYGGSRESYAIVDFSQSNGGQFIADGLVVRDSVELNAQCQ